MTANYTIRKGGEVTAVKVHFEAGDRRKACSQELEKGCNTDDCCRVIDTEPDGSSDKTPFEILNNHYSFTRLIIILRGC